MPFCTDYAFVRSGVYLLAAVASIGLTACTTVETTSFRVNPDSQIESAKIAVDADFGKYDRLRARDMGIFFPQNRQMSVENQQRMRNVFRGAFIEALSGYEVTGEPGPTTMAVQATLIDLREADGATMMNMRSDFRDFAVPGSLVFLMELRDSSTNRILAQAADSVRAPLFGGGTPTDWEAVGAAAKRWAALFRTFLDENLDQP